MSVHRKYCEVFAGLSGFFGVLAGALAAHKAQNVYAAELLQKASLYQLVHSVAILALSARREKAAGIACLFFAAGIVLFCGGLAFKALTGIASIGPLIPVGGTSLMLGWLVLAVMPFLNKP